MVASSINFLRIGAAAGGGIVGFAFGPLVGTTLAAVIAGPFAASGAIEVGRWAGMFAGAIGGAMLGAFLVGRPIVARACISMALIVGGVAFLIGFIGPIIVTPNSPQGPLLGILITGPFGLIIGGIVGLFIGLSRERRRSAVPSNRLSTRSG